MDDSYLSSKESLDIPYITFPDLLRKWAEKNPNKTAFIFVDEEDDRYELSLGELYDKATKFAKTLTGHGVRKGDVIALNGRNLPEWLIACFGIQLAGGSPLCLPYLQKKDDFVKVCSKLGPVKMLIIDPGSGGQNCQFVKDMIRTDFGTNNVESSEIPDLRQVVLFNHHESLPSVNTVVELCSRECDVDLPRLDPEDLGLILLTSGTTNTPKAVPYSHHALVISGHNYIHLMKTSGKYDSFYNDRPFYWIGGFALWEVASGGSRVTLINAMKSSSLATAAVKTCEIIGREKVTTALLIPPMLDLVMKKNIPLRLKTIATGGMIVHSALLKNIDKLCDEFICVYASTELGFIACNTFTEKDITNTTKGLLSCRPLPGIEIKVTDDDGFLLPAGQRGSIQVRSTRRFNGYLKQNLPPKSKETLERTGWFCPDDGGYVTENGELVMEGRLQEIIQVFTRKVFPFEIENVIKTKSNVSSAKVISLKDKETGDLPPFAAIVYHPNVEMSCESMQDYIRKEFNITTENQMLEYLYVPRGIVSFKQFPVLANGKPNLRAIRQIILETVDSEKYE
ncbi:indoleacetate--CoA ligase-like [Crassostrea virginica]